VRHSVIGLAQLSVSGLEPLPSECLGVAVAAGNVVDGIDGFGITTLANEETRRCVSTTDRYAKHTERQNV
jgi:hypothetical protein